MKKIFSIVLKVITILLIIIIYGNVLYGSFKAFFVFEVSTWWLFLVSISITIFFSVVTYKKKRNVFTFLFLLHFLAGIMLLGLEYYDMEYTSRYQLSDSILHYFGWITPSNDINSFMESRVYGFITSIVPSMLTVCNVFVFIGYSIYDKYILKNLKDTD